MLGLPAIAFAGQKELLVLHHAHIPSEAWSILAIGIVVASLSALVAIRGLMHFLERFSAWPFVASRAVLGAYLPVALHTGRLGVGCAKICAPYLGSCVQRPNWLIHANEQQSCRYVPANQTNAPQNMTAAMQTANRRPKRGSCSAVRFS